MPNIIIYNIKQNKRGAQLSELWALFLPAGNRKEF